MLFDDLPSTVNSTPEMPEQYDKAFQQIGITCDLILDFDNDSNDKPLDVLNMEVIKIYLK